MIKLTRERTDAAIPNTLRGDKRVKRNEELIKHQLKIVAKEQVKHEWDSGIWGKAKPQLLKETHNKCAYCETPTKVVAYGDVEHFRPKSIYWWLAYCYDNYLASCTQCNQAFKKDKFPILTKVPLALAKTMDDEAIKALAKTINPDPLNETEGMPWSDFKAYHDSETAFLINPYLDDPEAMLGYIANDDLMEVEIFVEKNQQHWKKIQKALFDDYGLNRLELKQLRYEWYDLYVTQKLTLQEPVLSAALRQRVEDKITRMLMENAPFAGMIRYFERVGIL